MADNAYLKVKVKQIDAEIDKHNAAIKALRERKKGYEAQITKAPAKPAE